MEQKMSASFTGCKTEGEAIMNQAYFDAVIRRYQKMEELDPLSLCHWSQASGSIHLHVSARELKSA